MIILIYSVFPFCSLSVIRREKMWSQIILLSLRPDCEKERPKIIIT